MSKDASQIFPIDEVEKIGLYQQSSNPFLFSDNEELLLNTKSGNLYSINCVNNEQVLYRRVLNIEDLKNAIWDGFPTIRHLYNLD